MSSNESNVLIRKMHCQRLGGLATVLLEHSSTSQWGELRNKACSIELDERLLSPRGTIRIGAKVRFHTTELLEQPLHGAELADDRCSAGQHYRGEEHG